MSRDIKFENKSNSILFPLQVALRDTICYIDVTKSHRNFFRKEIKITYATLHYRNFSEVDGEKVNWHKKFKK